MRILGSTGHSENNEDPLKAMQQEIGPDTERENNAAQIDKYSSTVKVRASQDRMLKEPRS